MRTPASKVKILHINYSDQGGGAEMFAVRLANLQGARLCVHVKRTSLPFVMQFQRNPFDHLLRYAGRILRVVGLRKTIRQFFGIPDVLHFSFRKLRDVPAYREADIIHLHNIHGEYFDIGAIAKIAAEKPVVWSLHDMWAITGGETYTFANQEALRESLGSPYSGFYIDAKKFLLSKKRKTYNRAAGNLTIVPDAIWLEKRMKSSPLHCSKNNILTIHCGIDTSTFFNLGSRNWSIPRIVIVNLSNPLKGATSFPEIFKEITNQFDLTVIGARPAFNTLARKTVVHPYFTDATQLQEVFNSNDLLIFPSLAEIFPLTVLIAMSCGLCVVASDVGGISEAINSDCGILVNPADRIQAGKTINDVIGDLDALRRIGARASERIAKHFSERHAFEQYESLYKQVISNATEVTFRKT